MEALIKLSSYIKYNKNFSNGFMLSKIAENSPMSDKLLDFFNKNPSPDDEGKAEVKEAAAYIGSNPQKPKKDLITPEINSSNKKIREGVQTNEKVKEQLSTKRKPPQAKFASLMYKLGFVSGIVNSIASKAAPMVSGISSKLPGLANAAKSGYRLVSKAMKATPSGLMARFGLPGAGSVAKGAKNLSKIFRPVTFGQAATDIAAIKGIDYLANKFLD